MEPRKYKKHTLLRRREAKKNNFMALDLPGKFAMIKRQRTPSDSFQLFQQLSSEEQLQFIRENYKGVKVGWTYRGYGGSIQMKEGSEPCLDEIVSIVAINENHNLVVGDSAINAKGLRCGHP